jgi:hypothetical protein
MAEEYEVSDVNPISKMVDYITQSEYTKANDVFNELLSQRVSDSLEQEKIAIAQGIYSDQDEESEDEISDEDLEDLADEYAEEEDEDEEED